MISAEMLGGLMALRPMMPAKDFAQSRLGFSAWPIGNGLCHMQIGDRDGLFCFLLQDAFAKEWAENFVMLLTVRKLDPWWDHIASLKLPDAFGVPSPSASASCTTAPSTS